jgi:mannose-6-phosphate isomerase-like protein (cupin superfamily)
MALTHHRLAGTHSIQHETHGEISMTSHHQPEFILAGVLMKQVLGGTDTNGTFSLFENSSEGLSQTPIHVHADDDETIYVMAGEMQAIIAGETSIVKAGQAAFLPRGIPHQLMNVSGQPSHYMLICTPSGFEGFLAEGGHERKEGEDVKPPTAEDIARLKAAAPKFGITLLPKW